MPHCTVALSLLLTSASVVGAAETVPPKLDTVLYGAAYYHEYMPYERLDKDIELMKRAGITVVRVGESTWTSWEPREGEFEFGVDGSRRGPHARCGHPCRHGHPHLLHSALALRASTPRSS